MNDPPTLGPPHTVFVSHVQADRAWARWIANVLSAAGKEVFGAPDLILCGESIERSVRNAIADADSVLVVLSERAARSRWVRAEVALASAVGTPAIAVIVDGAPAPVYEPWAAVVRVNDASSPESRQLLLEALDERHPDTRFALGRALRPPPPPPPVFVDRETEMRQLEAALLRRERGGPATVVITGPAGSGKTALAAAFIARHRAEFEAVLWLDAGDPSALSDGCVPATIDDERTLMVVDGVGRYDQVADLLHANPRLDVLLVSRSGHWGRPFQALRVAPLDRAAAMDLLRRVLPGCPTG